MHTSAASSTEQPSRQKRALDRPHTPHMQPRHDAFPPRQSHRAGPQSHPAPRHHKHVVPNRRWRPPPGHEATPDLAGIT